MQTPDSILSAELVNRMRPISYGLVVSSWDASRMPGSCVYIGNGFFATAAQLLSDPHEITGVGYYTDRDGLMPFEELIVLIHDNKVALLYAPDCLGLKHPTFVDPFASDGDNEFFTVTPTGKVFSVLLRRPKGELSSSPIVIASMPNILPEHILDLMGSGIFNSNGDLAVLLIARGNTRMQVGKSESVYFAVSASSLPLTH